MRTVICLIVASIFGCAVAIPSRITLRQTDLRNRYVDVIEGAPIRNLSPRVIGGAEVVPHSIPYQVALLANGRFTCGGSLITANYVLTAAHCVDGRTSISVLLGAHNIQQAEHGQVTLLSNNIIVHPQWSSSRIENDVALIRLPESVPFTENIESIHLAPAYSGSFAGEAALLTGWGRTTDLNNNVSPVLRKVDLTVLTQSNCQSWFGTSVRSTNICTGGVGNTGGSVGGCNGDSGGPLVIDGVQVGVVSFGSVRCEQGAPTVFARVSEFLPWIRQHSDYQ